MVKSLFFFIIAAAACGGTFYVSPKGSLKASGTETDPFGSLERALSAVGGGQVFVFLPGVYSGQLTLKPEHRGTPQHPTVLKSQEKYKAILHGSPNYGIYVHKGADWVIVDGFEVRSAGNDGILSDGDYNVIRNCWIRHNLGQGIISHNVTGSVYERNLIEFNGSNIQFDHGLYAGGEKLVLRQNLIRFNSSHGIHMYPSARNCIIENNLVYGNTRSGILVWCPEGGGQNRILQNTVVENGYGLDFKNGKGEVVANNIIAQNTGWSHSISNHALTLRNTKAEDLHMHHNLVFPRIEMSDPNTIYSDPQFHNPRQGVFYLKSASPALKKGSTKWVPQDDFWGRKRVQTLPPDLGCFPYDQSLLEKDYSQGWYYEWPFRCSFIKEEPIDLWKRPGAETGK